MKGFRRMAISNRSMNSFIRVAGLLLLAFVFLTTGYEGQAMAKTKARADRLSKRIPRGEYLVNTGGCHDCHTPWIMKADGPGPDMTRMLSGHPESMVMPDPPKLEGPWVWIGAGTNTAFAGRLQVRLAKKSLLCVVASRKIWRWLKSGLMPQRMQYSPGPRRLQ